MNREDAKYVINEIGWMNYVYRKAQMYKKEVDTIQFQLDHATDPKSPNGHENINAGRAMDFAGKEAYMNKKIADQGVAEKQYRKYSERFLDAQIWYWTILEKTDEREFVEDYFSRKYTRVELENKYHITKASKKIQQIVMTVL